VLLFSTLDLAERASATLKEPGQSIVPDDIAAPLTELIDALTLADVRHGPPPGFERLRPLAVAILDAANVVSPA